MNGFFDELHELKMRNFKKFSDGCAKNFILTIKLIFSHTVEIQEKSEKLSLLRVTFLLMNVNFGFRFEPDNQSMYVGLNKSEDVS